MRFWLSIVFFAMPIFAFNYNPLLLKAQASLFPKLLMLVKEPKKLLVDDTIVFAIVHESEDIQSASVLKGLIEEEYAGRLEGYPLRTVLVAYDKLGDSFEASAVIALHSETSVHDLARLLLRKKIISFVGDAAYLKEGFLFSLNLERSAVIYMNKPMLERYGVEFSDTLYHVVRFFDED